MNSSLFFQKYCLYFIITSDVELLVYFFVQLILSLNSIKVNDPIMWKTVSCCTLLISWLGGFYMMDYLAVNVRKWLLSIILEYFKLWWNVCCFRNKHTYTWSNMRLFIHFTAKVFLQWVKLVKKIWFRLLWQFFSAERRC